MVSGSRISIRHPSGVVYVGVTMSGAPVVSDRSAGPAGTVRMRPNISTSTPRPVKSRSATNAIIRFSPSAIASLRPTLGSERPTTSIPMDLRSSTKSS